MELSLSLIFLWLWRNVILPLLFTLGGVLVLKAMFGWLMKTKDWFDLVDDHVSELNKKLRLVREKNSSLEDKVNEMNKGMELLYSEISKLKKHTEMDVKEKMMKAKSETYVEKF